ncbi:MAG: pitrilysin family protein [Leptolyngbyaceae cyanobacterium bins.349]|nr:pitrilysin family protein [Leptolyngbyaceae cyanobacterium bins.349]
MFLFHRLRRVSFLILLVSSFLMVTIGATVPAIAQTPPPLPQGAKSSALTAVQPVSQPLSLTQGVQKTVLANGLTVLTKQVDTAPVVSVQVWYRIGSRNEAPGVNGIAHQLEHLMFKGTKERPIQFGRFFSALGSASNAFTSYDMTAYFGTVESDKLEALLVLEADRMKNSTIDESALTSEKRVVISELQGYENSPSYRLGRAVMRSAFPTSPYGLPVGGTKADVEQFTVDQVRYYYTTYYRPDNAVLVVVGNFKQDEVMKLVQQTFGAIPKTTPPLPQTPAPKEIPQPSAAPKPAIALREPGTTALLNAVYPLPDVMHPDVPALQLMDAILSSGRSSRLYQSLVETGLASEASGYAANLMGGGWYDFAVTAAPQQDLQQIDQVLQQVITEFQAQGVTAEELARAKAQLRASLILRNRDISSQAIQLGDDFISTGDYQFTDRLLANLEKVTPADVQRVARTYLKLGLRTVGFFEPTTLTGESGTPSGNVAQTSEKFSPGTPVDPAEVAKYLPPMRESGSATANQPIPEKLTLKNGMQVLLLRDRSTPTVSLSGFVSAGTVYDQPKTAGLAALTADNLLNGTKTRSALAIAKTLENRGATLSFGATREGVIISGDALAADLPTLVQVLGDVLQNAVFPDKELELSRQQALTDLKLELDNPGRVARRAFQQAVYPHNHPFHTLATLESLQKIARTDVVQFYNQQYRPEDTILALVGDFDPVAVRNLLAREFGDWQNAGPDPTLTFPTVPLPKRTIRLTPTLPGKTQSITFMGYNAINRSDSRFYAAQVLNQILGGDTLASRLGTEIRDRQGLTYGIYSLFQAGKNPGPFLVYMQTAPEDANRAIASTVSLLQQLRQQGVTPTEVAAAKRSLSSSYSVELASPEALVSNILMDTVYGLSLDEMRQYTRKIQAVTPEQVNQAIQELLHPDNLVIVTAGPPTSTPQK